MAGYDDPRDSDQRLLERVSELRLRDSLSRAGEQAKADMAAAGCSPADWAPLSVDEHLDLLQNQRWLEERLARRQSGVHRALQAGATWSQIADVLGVDVEDARAHFASWIEGQHQLHASIGIGLNDEAAAAAKAMLEEVATP